MCRTLTPRQRDVVILLAEGLNKAEIGHALYISVDTVRTHVAKARETANAANVTALVATALRRGWIE